MIAMVAVFWSSPRATEYLCSMRGTVGPMCGCSRAHKEAAQASAEHAGKGHGEHDPGTGDVGASVERIPCCIRQDRPSAPPAEFRAEHELPQPVLVASVGMPSRPGLVAPHTEERAHPLPRGPPPWTGPPLRVLHQSFQI